MRNTSVRISDNTQEKLNFVRKQMIGERILNGENTVVSWDMVYERVADYYLGSINPVLEDKAKKFEIEQKNLNELRKEILQEVNTVIRQNEFIKQQNVNAALELVSIKNFIISMNENLRNIIDSVKNLLSNISDMHSSFLQKIAKNIKHHFGISVPMILHHIVKDNNLLIKKVSKDEAIKEVNIAVGNYKKLYNSSADYSDDDINKLIDKYSMQEHVKK